MINLAFVDNLAGREDILILLNLGVKLVEESLVRSRIIDILEVLLRRFNSAEVVDERLGVSLV